MTNAAKSVRSPAASRLSHFLNLPARDLNALADLTKVMRRFRAHTEIVAEGDAPRWAFILLDGMACRFRTMSDGRRQILTFIIPGDICGLQSLALKRMDHSIATIVPTSIAVIKRKLLLEAMMQHPRINAALWWSASQDEAIQREHVVALGRRNAHARVAYLLCELVWRYAAAGIGDGRAIRLLMTQSDIADALGLTPVHVNRVIQDFRKERLIVLNRHELRLLDIDRLMDIADLNPAYLHLGGAPAEVEQECARGDVSG
jgi:CRP-like cAMP-binding protein